jgi:signal transduction histidine kinase
MSKSVARLGICDLIASALETLAPASAKLQVKVSYARRNRNYVVFSSRKKLCSILSALLANALQFAGAGGSLHIEHERIRGKRHNDRSDFIKIAVRIHGPGVLRNGFDVVIDKFQNISKLLCQKPQETAWLELVSTQERIHEIGGNIWVRSDLGSALTFFFTVPIEKQSVGAPDRQDAAVTIIPGKAPCAGERQDNPSSVAKTPA